MPVVAGSGGVTSTQPARAAARGRPMHTRIPGANLAKNAAEEAGREGGGASRRAALNGVARDRPGLVSQGVGVLTSAIAPRVESEEFNGGAAARRHRRYVCSPAAVPALYHRSELWTLHVRARGRA